MTHRAVLLPLEEARDFPIAAQTGQGATELVPGLLIPYTEHISAGKQKPDL